MVTTRLLSPTPGRKKQIIKMVEKEKILAKLRKLMNLKESASALGNEGEAMAAAAGISRLLFMYNLSETDIPEQDRIDNPIMAKEIPFKPEAGSGRWYESLIDCICKFNLCECVVVSTYKKVRYSADSFRIIGREKNIEVVLYLISFLSNRFYQIGKRKYSNYKDRCLVMGCTAKSEAMFLRSFLMGCVIGLHDKLVLDRREMCKKCDMMEIEVSLRSEIEDFLKDENITEKKYKQQELDLACAKVGYKEGRMVEITKGIYSESVEESKRIGNI